MFTEATPWSALGDLRGLQLFRDLLSQGPLSRLLDHQQEESSPNELLAGLLSALTEDERLLGDSDYAQVQDPWEAWLIDAVLASDNPWARCLERGVSPGELLDQMAAHDLSLLSRARGALRVVAEAARFPLPRSWQTRPRSLPRPRAEERREAIARLCAIEEWGGALDTLKHFYRSAGAGPFNQAVAFLWEGADSPRLVPVYALDPLRLEQLVGYERERGKVIENTERLIRGLPAHHLLLYGDRGTGKSATVKALIHRYADEGLRLIEVPKSRLPSLPRLIQWLEGRGLAFILFIDDLSFEATETEYKELKAFLEGSLRHPPAQVRVYATSNRRHLVQEYYSERRTGGMHPADDEVRRQDTLQEKLSLADRFGMTVIFPTPSQREYLAIVHALVRTHGIELPPEVVEEKALQWASWYNGRSARTARQFVESLIGKE